VVFKVECKYDLWQLKMDQTLMKWLKERRIFLFHHKLETISVQGVGWFSSRSTRLFDAGQAEIDLTDALKEYAMTFDPEKDDKEMEKGRAQVPVFELGIVKVKHRTRNNNGMHQMMSCYAVEIRCEQKNKNVLKRMIQNAECCSCRLNHSTNSFVGPTLPMQICLCEPANIDWP
jgi:hypothetical protein